MDFSLKNFRDTKVFFPSTFHMRHTLNKVHYQELEDKFKANKLSETETFKRLKERTSAKYYNEVFTAQTNALRYAESVFPTYKFLLPEVIIDDWLSMMDPHRENRRDHSLHQPLTAYIISQLLGNGNPNDSLLIGTRRLLTRCAEMFLHHPKMEYLRQYLTDIYPKAFPTVEYAKQRWAEAVFYQATIVAALFHDIGYPWQYISGVGKGVGIVETQDGSSLEVLAKSIYTQISNRLLIYPFYGYSIVSVRRPIYTWTAAVMKQLCSAFQRTHGFPGALAFQHLNDKVRDFPTDPDYREAMLRFIQDWAAVGILMHDMVREYKGGGNDPANPHFRLSFDTDPLSCLVSIADILEEFGRPSAKFTNSIETSSIGYTYPCQGTKVNIKNGILEITYLYVTPPSREQKKHRLDEIHDYFNSKTGYIDLSALDLTDAVCLFARA